MAITFDKLKSRVLQRLEDSSNDLYPNQEVVDEINNAKDEVCSLVRIYSDEFPRASGTVTFGIGDKEKALPSDFLELIRAESTPSGASQSISHNVIDFRRQDISQLNLDAQDLYFCRKSDGTYVLGRVYTTSSLVVTIYYIPDISDLGTSSTASYLLGPPPTDNLIMVKAQIQLLINRKRSEDAALMSRREQKLEAQLQENLKLMDKTDTRYVNYVDEPRYA